MDAAAIRPTSFREIYPTLIFNGMQQLVVASMIHGVGIWFFYREQWQAALLNSCVTSLLVQPVCLLVPHVLENQGRESESARVIKLGVLFFSSAYLFSCLGNLLGCQVTIFKTVGFTVLSLLGVGLANYVDREDASFHFH